LFLELERGGRFGGGDTVGIEGLLDEVGDVISRKGDFGSKGGNAAILGSEPMDCLGSEPSLVNVMAGEGGWSEYEEPVQCRLGSPP